MLANKVICFPKCNHYHPHLYIKKKFIYYKKRRNIWRGIIAIAKAYSMCYCIVCCLYYHTSALPKGTPTLSRKTRISSCRISLKARHNAGTPEFAGIQADSTVVTGGKRWKHMALCTYNNCQRFCIFISPRNILNKENRALQKLAMQDFFSLGH